ncbi:uncharacterized protein HaLaN_05714 [Haematococcus lacustris]|uniref:Uncharacterized protein n=1 Tax=Haematococcus lacustris TaxID=44745 RepID=A0A699YJJ4_HAELA|nr:uncharacterized protein HaLaN_05714 [Haematococcus lacustris]
MSKISYLILRKAFYLAPRPVRLALCYCCAASCGLALLLGIVSLVTASPSLDSLVTSSEGALSDPLRNLLVNALGLAAFVDDTWILRRLERWGRKDGMPFLGPAKEVGTMAGGRQAMAADPLAATGLVDVRLGDAVAGLAAWQSDRDGAIQLLFLDGLPKQTLAYLKAAEASLEIGAVVVADNAGVFAQGGMRDYLEYVRNSPRYSSRYLESTLEWREDVADGLEVSVFLG